MVVYTGYLVLDRNRCEGHGYPCDRFPFRTLQHWIRNNYLYAMSTAYHPIYLHKTAELPATDTNGNQCRYFFTCHPHGVISVGTWSVFCSDEVGFAKLFPGIEPCVAGIKHAFFVPFISRISEYLATDLSSYDVHLFAEENISRTIAVNLQMSASVEMIAPDSQYYYLSPEEENGNLILKPQPTNLPGIYNVRYLGREIDRFALNVNPDECNLAGVIDEQFADAIGADDYRLVQQNTNAASIISEFRFGKELWQIFLWIAVLFIIAEMLLSKGVGKGDS